MFTIFFPRNYWAT